MMNPHPQPRPRKESLSGRYQGQLPPIDPYAAAASRTTAISITNSPPLSQNSTDNSLSSRPHSGRSPSGTNSHISSSSSVARSSDGAGFFPPNSNEARLSLKSNKDEAALRHHYVVLKQYLAPYLRDEAGNKRPTRARDKLLRLSPTQFNELSTDVFDEYQRREDDRRRPGGAVPPSLPPKSTFHPKRNQARQKLSTLPPDRFRQLATDVFFELERRIPQLTGGDRPGSPNGSISSRNSARMNGGRAPPQGMRFPSGQAPNGMRGPPPPGMRPGLSSTGPVSPSPYSPSPYSPSDDGLTPPRSSSRGGPVSPGGNFGRPLPQTFQSNTMVPNKSTMVEDDETDEEDDDAYGLTKVTSPSETDLETIKTLEAKVAELEQSLRDRDEIIDTHKNEHTKERDEWSQTRGELDLKITESQHTLETLQAELNQTHQTRNQSETTLRARTEQTVSELQNELEEVRKENDALRTQAPKDADDDWQNRYMELQEELVEQQKVTEEVRQNAEQFLKEMKSLSEQSESAVEKEEQLRSQIKTLEAECEQWKGQYTKTRTQLRSLKASSMGLSSQHSMSSAIASSHEHVKANGLVQDMDLTSFQTSIDELLRVAREVSTGADTTLAKAKSVVQTVRSMTSGIEGNFSNINSPHSSISQMSQSGVGPTPSALKVRVSRDANNLVTVARNHAAAKGLAPVSLVDAAASNLTTSVIELVKSVGVRSTQNGFGEEESSMIDDDVDIDEIAPLSTNKPVLVQEPQKQTAGGGWFSMLKSKSEVSDEEDEYDYS